LILIRYCYSKIAARRHSGGRSIVSGGKGAVCLIGFLSAGVKGARLFFGVGVRKG